MLEATDLYKFFHTADEETLALRGVSVSVAAGEIVAITGPSGSGKSTLLACLAGLDEPDGGMVVVAGTPLSRRPEAERSRLRSRHIGMLFQSNNLLDHLSVAGNVAIAQRLRGRTDNRSIPELLEILDLGHRATARPSQLSGGESARAGLAVALANDPDIIVADEPTGELDVEAARAVLGILAERAANGAAVVLVTHNADVTEVAHRIVELDDGAVAIRQAKP